MTIDFSGPDSPHFKQPEHALDPPQDVAAWEEVEPGRYLPRRVRGSCVGRALG